MEDRYQAKVAKHDLNCRKVNVLFAPLVFSTGGDVHPKSLPILYRLADLRAQRQGISSTVARQHFLHRLGVMIQRGNALGIIRHQQRAVFNNRKEDDTQDAMEQLLSRCRERCRCDDDALDLDLAKEVNDARSSDEMEVICSKEELELRRWCGR